MPFYTLAGGDSNWTVYGARHFRARERYWHVRVDNAGGGTITVKVYEELSDASAGNTNYCAVGGGSAPSVGTYAITLNDNPVVPPTWSAGASFSVVQVVVETVPSGGEAAIWTIDLGKREDRIVHEILRAMTDVQTTNGYLHTVAAVELGARATGTIPSESMPWVGVGRGLITLVDRELGHSAGGGGQYEMILQCEAHLRNADDEAGDTNVFSLLHDLRRAIEECDEDTWEGDGRLWSSIEVRQGDPDRPVDFIADLGYVQFDVIAGFQLSAADLVAG